MVMRSALVVGIAVAGVLALASTAGASTDVSCGDTITTDTTLHHNLVNCPNNGLVIGADNVTLDLNYHRIDGDGTPATGCDPRRSSAIPGWPTTVTTGSR